MIADRNLKPGTKLVARHKSKLYHSTVEEHDGATVYVLGDGDGRVFRSPSSAATAITQKAANGWTFWSLDVGEGSEEKAPRTPKVSEPKDEPKEEPKAPRAEQKKADKEDDGKIKGSSFSYDNLRKRSGDSDKDGEKDREKETAVA